MQTILITIKKIILRFSVFLSYLLIPLTALQPSILYADNAVFSNGPYPFLCDMHIWRPIIALGAGYISAGQVGASAIFPIIDPVTDSFYVYTPNTGRSSEGIFDGFLGIEIAFGNSGGGIQLGIGYAQTVPFTVKGTLVQGTASTEGTFSYQYNFSAKQVLIEGKLFAGFDSIYHPYIFGGIGRSFNRAYQFTTTVPPFLSFTRIFNNNTVNSYSYAVGVGIDFALDEVFSIGIGYRYASFGGVSLGSAVIDTTPVPGKLAQNDFSANELLLQLTAGFY